MTIKELKEIIKDFDDSAEVYLSHPIDMNGREESWIECPITSIKEYRTRMSGISFVCIDGS